MSEVGKKILVSIGGGVGSHKAGGEQKGREFADFLWGGYGPQTQEWLDVENPDRSMVRMGKKSTSVGLIWMSNTLLAVSLLPRCCLLNMS